MRIGYARVSTRDQHPEAQQDALLAAGCDQVFIDKITGKLANRPELDKALMVARDGDQFVITKLDRLGRSLANLIDLSRTFDARGIDLVVLDQGIDTSTAIGRMFFQILGAIAEFEHALMSERTVDGLEAARARGRAGGRRAKLTERQIADARRMYEETGEDGKRVHTVQDIADAYGVSRPTIYRHLEKAAEAARGTYTAAVRVRQAALGDVKPMVDGEPGTVSPEWIAADKVEQWAKAVNEPARDAQESAAMEQ